MSIELAGFTTQLKARPIIKYGFIGLGQAGGKMVDAFASLTDENKKQIYPCIAINTNKGDMDALENVLREYRFSLKGYEGGAGKDREIGKQAFLDNAAELFEKISEIFKDTEILFLAASLGGGTGSGTIKLLSDAISEYLGKRVIAITALPRPNEIESLNAFNGLNELTEGLKESVQLENGQTIRLLEGIVIMDNEKIWQEHSANPESNLTWDKYSNNKVAAILHEWNMLVSLSSEIMIDAQDLQNHIFYKGGTLSFSKKMIDATQYKNVNDIVYEAILTYKERNVLANGFNYQQDLKNMALVMVVPKEMQEMINQDTLELIRSKANVEFPNVNFIPGMVTWGSKKNILVYTIATFNGLPERAVNLRNEAIELKRIREERENRGSGFNLGEAIETKSSAPSNVRKVSSGNPFAKSSPTSTVTKPVNPFRK